MSTVTNVILTADVGEAEHGKAVPRIVEWLLEQEMGHPPLLRVDDLVGRQKGKAMEADVWVGAYNCLDLAAFVDVVEGAAWLERDDVALFVLLQDGDRFEPVELWGRSCVAVVARGAVTITDPPELRAWCNGYEVVAARSENGARHVLLFPATGKPYYYPADVDGDGWTVLDGSALVRDEGGAPTGKTVAERVRELGEPGHLWSVDT